MTDDELRALVRDSVARHLGLTGGGAGAGMASAPAAPLQTLPLRMHPSHYRYTLATGSEDTSPGPCLIEPTVTCNHCGYCQSHGH